MHQRSTVTSRSRQQVRREKIFRSNKEQDAGSDSKTNGGKATDAAGRTRPSQAAGTSGGAGGSSGRSSPDAVSRPGRNHNSTVVIKGRDGGTGSTRSHSRDGGAHRGSTSVKVYGTAGHGTPRRGSPAKLLGDGTSKSEFHHSHGDSSYSEEPHLSKLVSRVLRDDERERRLTACLQLKDFVQNADNVGVIQKMGLGLIQELARVFFDRTSLEIKEEVALSIGILATTLRKDAQNFLQWLFRKYESTSNEEAQVLLLQSLLETMKYSDAKNDLDRYMPLIMSHVQSALEVTDSQPLLVAIVNIVLLVAQRDPDAFHSHFHDTVDILVGWHIDPQQSESILRFTSTALVQFHPFWATDISFSVTLLGQFLEDVEAYAEEQATCDGSTHASGEDLPGKIASLIRVYSTVVRSLKHYFSPQQSSSISLAFISDNFSRLLSSVLLACSAVASELILVAANDCVSLLLGHLKECTLPHMELVTALVQLQLRDDRNLREQQASSLLQLACKVVLELNVHLPAEFLAILMGPKSLFPKLRFWPSGEIQQRLLEMYRSIFSLKTVPLLEEAYKYVLSDLHTAFRSLLDDAYRLPEPFDFRYDAGQAQSTVVFDLCAIAEVANTKNSLISMLALNPSIFDLLTNRLKPTDVELATRYPSLQYAIVYTLYSHCTNHSHFVNNSSLVNTSEIPATDRPTSSGHFTIILDLLSRILSGSCHGWDVRSLALKWTQNLVISARGRLKQICVAPSFVQLLHSLVIVGFNDESAWSRLAVTTLCLVLEEVGDCLAPSILSRCYELYVVKISDSDDQSRPFFENLSSHLPLAINLSTVQKESPEYWPSPNDERHILGMRSVLQSRQRLQSRSPLGTFTCQDFRTMMSFILQGNQPPAHWLTDMFATDQRSEKLIRAEDRMMATLADVGGGTLWFWGTYEAALFCVLSKLRTPLGKPQDTLSTIEAAVKSFAMVVLGQQMVDGQFGEITRLGSSLSAASGVGSDGTDDVIVDTVTDSFAAQLRAKILIDFLEQLEKLIYNAYEGCAIVLASAPKAVKTFFRTNKATCQEWLGRIRKAALTLALHLGHPAFVVRHGYQMLWDLRGTGLAESSSGGGGIGVGGGIAEHDYRQVAQVVLPVVQALVALHAPDAILGLYVWCRDELGLKLSWIKAAVEMAAGRYEAAAHDFSAIIATAASAAKAKDQTEADSLPEVTTLINDRSHNHQHDHGVAAFMRNQVLESYRRLGSWAELANWLADSRPADDSSPWPVDTDPQHLHALATFDGLDSDAWRRLGETHTVISGWSLSPRAVRQRAEQSLMQVVNRLRGQAGGNEQKEEDDDDEVLKSCEATMEQVSGLMRLAAMESSLHFPLELLVLGYVGQHLRDMLRHRTEGWPRLRLDVEKCLHEVDSVDVAAVTQALRWSRHFTDHDATSNNDRHHQLNNGSNRSTVTDDLYLVSAKAARKSQNLHVAQRLILGDSGGNREENQSVLSVVAGPSKALLQELELASGQELSTGAVRYCREGTKLLHALGAMTQATKILSAGIGNVAYRLSQEGPRVGADAKLRSLAEMNARSLLTLVKWMVAEPTLSSSLNGDPSFFLGETSPALDSSSPPGFNGTSTRPAHLLSTKLMERLLSSSFESSDIDATVGRFLWLGTRQCPWLAKAWAEFGAWCYRAGKRAVDRAGDCGIELTAEERHRVRSLLNHDHSIINEDDDDDDDSAAVCQIISQIHCFSDDTAADSGDLSREDGENGADGGSCVTTYRRQALLACAPVRRVSVGALDALLSLWDEVTDRVYAHYRLACEAYFAFLKLNGSCGGEVGEAGDTSPVEDANVVATLRLLRLMVKHALELRDVLEVGLANTPTAPWKGIIPQLFSRLNHPEPYVRRSISDLLCRVTAAAPHLIVFPAVVGSSGVPGEIKDGSGVLGDCLSQTSDDELGTERGVDAVDDLEGDVAAAAALSLAEENRHKVAIMQNCFAAMVETLAKRDPRSIAEVQRLVHELRRITLLWDEFWLGTLGQYQLDFGRRVAQLEKEIARVRSNPNLLPRERLRLISRKHDTFLRPTLFVLEQLDLVTSQPPETPHEEWFRDTFGALIRDVIDKLRHPASPDQPQTSWLLYKQLLAALQQRVQKRSSLSLDMAQISPCLAGVRATGIAMPGAATTSSGGIVTVESIDHAVSILPTKTKPKRLTFRGSDGKRYSFLFKGLEDLHLDERIMQLLCIVNNMFARGRRGSSGVANYRARHYSVTPLGPRSGLIQWVEGATPLFGLYKRWQQREVSAPPASRSGGGGNVNVLLRPSEIFYGKLTPLLKEKGIASLVNRKEWPLAVLRQVLTELMAETPHDLLARELWCACTGALDWWRTTETYAQSAAVMSVIGYVIGLGDRHLDNILVDLESGEVIHIDYNVCFEKGKNLRVPEKVPFRMTPNLRTALGLTGVEGTFRVTCEHVLKTLRRGRETLLTLLEAFVYDPLIDWTPGSEGGYTGAVYGGWQQAGNGAASKLSKLEMERSLVHSMFYIRLQEMKTEWGANRDDLMNALPKLEVLLKTWLSSQRLLHASEEELQELHQQMAFAKEAEANAVHPLHTLHQRCRDYLLAREQLDSARAALHDKMLECDHWSRLHEAALEAVCGAQLGRWRAEAAQQPVLGALVAPPVVEFLQAAGKGPLLQQCEQAEKDMAAWLAQQQSQLRTTLDALATYATVVSQSPAEGARDTRNNRWRQWLRELHDDTTVATCHRIISQFHASTSCGPGGNHGRDSVGGGLDVATARHVLAVEFQLQTLAAEANAKLHKICERLHLENADSSAALSRGATLEESRSAVAQYVSEHGEYAARSLACAAVSALAAHGRRLGVLESAALAAGERLADYTLRDGDWFLDEVFVVSASVDELARVAGACAELLLFTPQAVGALEVVAFGHQVVATLQELHLNFRTIILPEAIRCVRREEPSVLDIFRQLAAVIAAVRTPLPVLVQELEMHVRSVVMEMEPPSTTARHLAEELREQCRPLLEQSLDEASDELSPGQMLLMGFNGLFGKLESDFGHYREQSAPVLISMPPAWRKVDAIKEARSRLAPVFVDEAYRLLRTLFFVKRLQAMTDFFNLLQQHCNALRVGTTSSTNSTSTADLLTTSTNTATAAATLYSEETMSRPVRSFIAEFIGKMLLGLPTQGLGLALCRALECCCGLDVTAEVDLREVGAEHKVALDDLCRKAAEAGLRAERFHTTHLNQAAALVAGVERVCRKMALASQGQNVVVAKSTLQRAQLQLTHHQWMHEDLLANGTSLTTPTRSSVMAELRQGASCLLSLESALSVSRERYLSLSNGVEQRLRWAAGANPSVEAVREEFERSVSAVNQLVVGLVRTGADVAAACGTLRHLEAMRGGGGGVGGRLVAGGEAAAASDAAFLQLINRCQESCLIRENCRSVVEPLEEKLLRAVPLDDLTVTAEWIASVTHRIAGVIGEVGRRMSLQKTDLQSSTDAVKNHVLAIRVILGTHHRLMNEIRAILKSMAKYEDRDQLAAGDVTTIANATNNESVGAGVRRYVAAYRTYSEHITVLVREALSEELTAERAAAYLATVDTLRAGTAFIYDTLEELGERLGLADDEVDARARDVWPVARSTANGSTIAADKMESVSGKRMPEAPSVASTRITENRKLLAISAGGVDLLSGASPASQTVKAPSTGTLKKTPVTRDPRTGKAVQERNLYAVSVWKRVKMKLDGKEHDAGKKFSVPEQVDFIIKEATSIDNLATLYDGWTPWV